MAKKKKFVEQPQTSETPISIPPENEEKVDLSLREDVVDWISNYDLKINGEKIKEDSFDVTEKVGEKIIKSLTKRNGVVNAVKKSLEFIKNKLKMESVEVDVAPVNVYFNALTELELFISVTQESTIIDDLHKNTIINNLVDNFYNNKTRKQTEDNKDFKLLASMIEEIYKKYGELPSNDINKVVMTKNAREKKPEIKPFGRKK
jgi:hypothetical protein